VGTLAQSLRDMVSTLKSMIAVAEEKTNEAEAAAEAIISSIVYASKIQRSLLPKEHVFQNAFSDYSVVWNPRDIVGGDIYWAKTFNNGTVLCVCDCTGHGTSGALLTMLVASALDSTVEEHNCRDTAAIMWHLEKSLVHVLSMDIGALGTNGNAIRDGCDLALLFVARDGSVTLSSSHTHVFVCDGNEVNQIRGQNIYIGEGRLTSKDDIRITNIPANPDNKFYIASDGLFDQPGGASKNPFGYTAFKRIILENHGEKQSVISARICAAFEEYRGMEPRVDDFELITFKP
jgi:serine phosphatase RsbU (regulator of sigma subunit)